jgi:hypothetical protein
LRFFGFALAFVFVIVIVSFRSKFDCHALLELVRIRTVALGGVRENSSRLAMDR